MAVGLFVQISFAICLVVFLYVIAYFTFNKEVIQALQTTKDTRRKVPIFEGVKDLLLNNNEIYNTSDEKDPSYRKMELSINQRAGAEFSYNFWIYKKHSLKNKTVLDSTDPNIHNLNDLILFVKGSKKPIPFKNICGETKTDFLVKCPLVKFEQDLDVLTVEVNTNEVPEGVGEGSPNTCKDTSTQFSVRNGHKLSVQGFNGQNYVEKWFMLTIVLQDTTPTDPLPFRNNVKCLIYVNGVLHFDKYIEARLANMISDRSTAIRQNRGNLYLAPVITAETGSEKGTMSFNTQPQKSGNIEKLYMADLTYYNYALGKDEVHALYKAGFNKRVAAAIGDSHTTRNELDDIQKHISAQNTQATKIDLISF
jgi:hypothetical protein